MSQLITCIEDLKQAVNINRDTDLTGILPALDGAEALVARQLGGFGLIDELLALPNPNGRQLRALTALRRAVGTFAVLKAMPSLNVQITDAGVKRTTGADAGDAFQWQYDELKSSLATDGWDVIEDLLAILEEYPADFPAWQTTRPEQLLVPSAKVFNQFYFIGERRLTYQAMLPSMRRAEGRQIRPFLTRQNLTVATLTDEQLLVVQEALVYATLNHALLDRQIDITEAGLQVLGISESSTTAGYRKPVDNDARINRLITYYQQQASATLQALVPAPAPNPLTRLSPIIGGAIVGF